MQPGRKEGDGETLPREVDPREVATTARRSAQTEVGPPAYSPLDRSSLPLLRPESVSSSFPVSAASGSSPGRRNDAAQSQGVPWNPLWELR